MGKVVEAQVYRHRRLDNFDIFYVGLATQKSRPTSKHSRSRFWNGIVNKTDYEVEIVAEGISKEQACELEIFLIQEYGRRDLKEGTLCNMTDGGEGVHRKTVTPEIREKIRVSLSGRKRDPKIAQKMLATKRAKGITNKHSSKEVSQFSLDGTLIKVFSSAVEAGLSLGAKNGKGVSRVCQGLRNKYKNFNFKYN